MFRAHPYCSPWTLNIQPLLVFPYLCLIAVGIFLPSDGSHGLLSMKGLSFVISSYSFLVCILLRFRCRQVQGYLFAFLAAGFAFFAFWILLSTFYNETPLSSAIDQCKLLWLTFFVTAAAFYFVEENLLSFSTMLHLVIYVNFVTSLVKLLLVVGHLFGAVNIFRVINALDLRFMSMDITGSLFRFQLSTDILTPFFIFFFLRSPQLGITWPKGFKFVYIIVSFLSLFLSFSRFLVAVGFFSLLLHMWLMKKSEVVRLLPKLVIFILLGCTAIGWDQISLMAERRLFSSENRLSDRVRNDQIRSLLDDHEKFPLFGKGMGSFATHHIRDEKILYSYEVQWLAFLMQFGIIGVSLLLIPLGVIGGQYLSGPWNKTQISFLLLYGLWLFSGFTNPFLISLASGVMYALFLLYGRALLSARGG